MNVDRRYRWSAPLVLRGSRMAHFVCVCITLLLEFLVQIPPPTNGAFGQGTRVIFKQHDFVAPLGAFAWGAYKNRVRPCVRQKHEVLSRSKSTGYFRCFRGKGTIGFSSRFFGIPDFHRFRGKGTISRVPKKDHFFRTF